VFALAATLLAGCPLVSDDGHHAYLGAWKLDSCSGGFGGARECTDHEPEEIVLWPDQYDEYRQGTLYLSAGATYLEEDAACAGRGVTLRVDAQAFIEWCLPPGDGENLYACESCADCRCWHFRR
jgi:hypothetical protein